MLVLKKKKIKLRFKHKNKRTRKFILLRNIGNTVEGIKIRWVN